MKAASKIVRIFVVGMVITLSSLLAFSPAKAETVTYHGAYKATRYYYEGSSTPGTISYFWSLTIVTDDENAYGTVNVTGLGTFNYSGLVTYYDGISSTATSSVLTGSFTGTYNSVAQETTLDSTQYNSILNALNTINTTDQNIKNAIDSMKNSIMSILNNIDDIIDTISWNNIDFTFGASSTITGESVSSGSLNNRIAYVDIPNTLVLQNRPVILHLQLPLGKGTSGNINITDIKLYYYQNTNVYYRNVKWYATYRRRYVDVYLYDFMTYPNYNYRISIDTNITNPFTISEGYNAIYEYIESSDIEYWTLMSYFNSINQQSSANLNNMNSQLDPTVNDMITNEDNLISDFDNSISNPNVKPSTNTSSNPSGWGTGFTSSIGFVGYVYNQLLQSSQGGNPFYMLINFSLMLGLALLIIGKRG